MLEASFLADVMLGTLSKWMRILGYDTRYSGDVDGFHRLLRTAGEKRKILTRRRALRKLDDGNGRILFIRGNYPSEQLLQVVKEYGLTIQSRFIGSRCILCNQLLREVPVDRVRPRVPEYIAINYTRFSTCPSCNRIFWRGSHFENMVRKIEKTLGMSPIRQ